MNQLPPPTKTLPEQTESVVEELIRERREEVAREDAEEATYQARPGGPMTREQFRARLAAIEARYELCQQR